MLPILKAPNKKQDLFFRTQAELGRKDGWIYCGHKVNMGNTLVWNEGRLSTATRELQ